MLVRSVGFEPTRDFSHHPLKVACLPFHHARMYINQCITYRGGIDGENGYAREKHAFAPPTV